ncbi:polysaccharide biosynthesis/export family protein [Novosphingobium sp. PhB55]|uniref:polysaccharide biosynthesis/export family protein n=1 Tax=Novosphingobium sp. PhB55 TaxID=2485106 RepID=UPI001064F758|nr:polysaccharide biosynthesis/export family protein [Novosphingobium sp. PhB55]
MQHRKLFVFAAACLLGGCSTLPRSGPTGAQVEESATADGQSIVIVEVNNASVIPARSEKTRWIFPDRAAPPTDMVGPGDILAINIYEAGVPLFGANAVQTMAGPAFEPGASVQALPLIRVDDNGDIVVPFAGSLHVIGKTVGEVQDQIRRSLRGLSENPQVLVSRQQVITNSVIVGGEVMRPGRLVLDTNQERFSDVLALSGGYRGNAKDLALRVSRGGQVDEVRLDEVLENTRADGQAYPGDRLTVVQDPLLFSVLGASGHVQHVPFSRSSMSLLEAIATSGGPSDNSGDPAAVFLFRYEQGPDGFMKPVVYHVNMMKTGSYFLAQNFHLKNNDIIYFGSAAANQPRKLIQMISQLFAPIVTVTSVANNVGN